MSTCIPPPGFCQDTREPDSALRALVGGETLFLGWSPARPMHWPAGARPESRGRGGRGRQGWKKG